MIELRIDELFAKFTLIDCIFGPLTRLDMEKKMLLFWAFQVFHPDFFWKAKEILERRDEIAEKILKGKKDTIFEVIRKIKLPKNWKKIVKKKEVFR